MDKVSLQDIQKSLEEIKRNQSEIHILMLKIVENGFEKTRRSSQASGTPTEGRPFANPYDA